MERIAHDTEAHMRINPFKILLAIAMVFIVSTTAYAKESATDFVRSKSDEIVRVINTSKDKDVRLTKLRTSLQNTLDYELLAQRTLAMHWGNLSAKQQTDFTAALKDLLETSYVSKLGDRTVDPGSYSVQFLDERERRGRYTVETVVKAEKSTYNVDLRLQKSDGTWKVYDVITDDVSLEESYAESFDEIIRTKGFDELMKRLQNKTKELKKP